MKLKRLFITVLMMALLPLSSVYVYADPEDIPLDVDYYGLKQSWDSGQIPSYVNWYNCLMPRLMLFYSGIISKNNGYELYY